MALAACSHAPSEPPAGPTLEILLDGELLTTATITEPIALARLVPYLPPPTWLVVSSKAPDGRYVELESPAISYPRAEVRIYLERGKPALGVFNPVEPNLPAAVARIAAQPLASLHPISRLEILTKIPDLLDLDIEVDGRPLVIAAPALEALHTQRGVAVATLFDAPHRQIRIIAPTGEQTFPWSALQDRDVRLKQNRQGEYVFRVWDNQRDKAFEVRDVTKIVVE